MSGNFADLCLMMTKEPVIIGLFLIGFTFFDRRTFLHALCLLLFTMIYNHWLKSLWQIPLNPALGKQGWAFPSGHMHSSFVFMGFIAWHYSRLKMITIPVILVLTGVGCSLIVKGYHNLSDVLGACAFGSLSVFITDRIEAHSWAKKRAWSIPLFFLFLSVCLLIALAIKSHLQGHLFLASGALSGLFAGTLVRKPSGPLIRIKAKNKLIKKSINFVVTISGMGTIFFLLPKFSAYMSPYVLAFFTYFLTGLWIILASKVFKPS